MFTIKHIDADGNEFAIEAASYEIKRERHDGKPVLLRLMTYDTLYRDGNYSGFWVGVATQGTPASQCIYVMNQHGATIATMTFDAVPDDYWHERGDGMGGNGDNNTRMAQAA